jgi:hypothetical protein
VGQILNAREQTSHLAETTEERSASSPQKLEITCQSAGFKSGNFARIDILLDGEVQIARCVFGRGLNIVVIDPISGLVTETGTFDTHISQEESNEFAKTIEWIEPGFIVVVVSKDECSENLTLTAKEACESLGSQHVRQVGYRDSWCLIGEKGALPGSVPEAFHASKDGPTKAITLLIDLKSAKSVIQDTLQSKSKFSMILPSQGRWLRRRKIDGALNRVPPNFYPKVWKLLSKCEGLKVGKAFLPRDPTIYEKTPEELNFGKH